MNAKNKENKIEQIKQNRTNGKDDLNDNQALSDDHSKARLMLRSIDDRYK